MQIAEIYSHLNGMEFLQVHKPDLLQEIIDVIDATDAEECKTKVSKERNRRGQLLYSPIDMNRQMKILLEQKGWEESRVHYWVTKNYDLVEQTINLEPEEQKRIIESSGATAISGFNQTDFVKDRVAIEVQFGKYAFVAYDLFVKHLAFYVGRKIDVGIEILPMKSLQHEMSSGPGCYEKEIYNVIRQGRGTPVVPLVIIGIEP